MELLTTRQAADRLGVTVSTISRWATAGKIVPAIRLDNGQMLFRPADIARLEPAPKAAS